MCETLRAELKLSFKLSTLDLTIVGAHYDVPNDSQQVICPCQYQYTKIACYTKTAADKIVIHG